MRLNNFLINEERMSPQDVVTLLERKCKPFLKDIRKGGKIKDYMYSGRISGEWVLEKKVREDRVPRDTPNDLHKVVDRLFQKVHGWKARSNSIFTTGDLKITKEYGRPYLIFPVGNYKFLYHPEINDLFLSIQKPSTFKPKHWYSWIIDLFLKDEYLQSMERQEDKIQVVIEDYKNDSIIKAIQSKREIMVNCNEYIGVVLSDNFSENQSFTEDVKTLLNGGMV